MKTYAFILGRNASLSKAEIDAVFRKNGWDNNELVISKEVYVLESEKADPGLLHKTLGGTVKIGIVLKTSTIENLESDLDIDLFHEMFSSYDGKIQFGISVYDGGERDAKERLSSLIVPFSKGIKALLEETGRSVRFAFSKERMLSSVTVDKNKLIQKGAELLLIPTRSNVYIGKTLFVQEFEAFSKRDYGRPVRDMKSGVMPPKLARIMINLSEASSEKKLLDPFCGSGTVLQEALLLGFTNVFGCDISQKAVEDSKTNIEWLRNNHFSQQEVRVTIKNADVSSLSKEFEKNSMHAIVTEPYLGPTLHSQMYEEKLKRIAKELSQLYLRAFSEFHKILEKDGVVVMILPVFVQRKGMFYLQILDQIEALGFKKEVIQDDNNRGSVLYGNKYDFVLREIVKMKKV